jgi:hypothetical protein
MMQGVKTDKTSTRRKEQVGIGTSQARQSIERDTVDGRKDQSGETRLREELNPMRIVVIRHDMLY